MVALCDVFCGSARALPVVRSSYRVGRCRREIEIKRRGEKSIWGVPTLRDELKRLCDDCAHYAHNARGADAIKAAMKSAHDIRTGYVIKERFLRAEYADTVAMTLTHPFPLIELYTPVEAAWASESGPPETVTSKRF